MKTLLSLLQSIKHYRESRKGFRKSRMVFTDGKVYALDFTAGRDTADYDRNELENIFEGRKAAGFWLY